MNQKSVKDLYPITPFFMVKKAIHCNDCGDKNALFQMAAGIVLCATCQETREQKFDDLMQILEEVDAVFSPNDLLNLENFEAFHQKMILILEQSKESNHVKTDSLQRFWTEILNREI